MSEIVVRFGAITDEALADALHHSSAEDIDIHRMAEELTKRRAADLSAAEQADLAHLRAMWTGAQYGMSDPDMAVTHRRCLAVLDRLLRQEP